MSKLKADHSLVEAENSSLKSQVADLERQRAGMASTIDNQKNELQEVSMELGVKRARVDALQKDVFKLTHELNETKLSQVEFEKEREWFKSSAQRYQKQFEFSEKKSHAFQEQLEVATADRLKYSEMYSEVKDQLDKRYQLPLKHCELTKIFSEAEISRLLEQIRELRRDDSAKEIQRKDAIIKKLEAELVEIRQEKDKLFSENYEIRISVEKLKAQNESQEMEIYALNQRKISMEKKIADLENECAKLPPLASELERTKQDYNRLQKMKDEVDILNSENEHRIFQLQEINRALEVCKTLLFCTEIFNFFLIGRGSDYERRNHCLERETPNCDSIFLRIQIKLQMS